MSKEVALNFLQAMIFSQRTEEMKNENPYFSGGIANQYQQYVVNRAGGNSLYISTDFIKIKT